MMKILIFFLSLIYTVSSFSSFLEENPHLKEFLFEEPFSHIYYGMGLSPLSIMNGKVYLTGNLFQLHRIKDNWDIELFSTSMGTTINSKEYLSSKHFTFRTIPKYRVLGVISVGPLLGYEFIRFPNISARLYKNRYVTPWDVFTSYGVIYGIGISETFQYKTTKKIKLNQNIYKQTYSTTTAKNDWKILYRNPELGLSKNQEELAAGWVFMMEISLLL